jgi:hypothetical protein
MAGGTGSGLINDIAAIARMALESVDTELADSHIAGWFCLPFAVLGNAYTSPEVASCMSNAYAALKEVDHFYSRFQRDQHFADKFIYPGETFTLDINHPSLYDTVCLFSKSGSQVCRDICSTIAQSIWSLSSCEDSLSWQSLQAIELNHRIAIFAFKQECGSGDDYTEDTFRYHSMSVQSAGVPLELIKAWAFNKILKSFYLDESGQEPGLENGYSREPLLEEGILNIRKAAEGGFVWFNVSNQEFGGRLEEKILNVASALLDGAYESSAIPLTGRDVKGQTDEFYEYKKKMETLAGSLETLSAVNQMIDSAASDYRAVVLDCIKMHGPKAISQAVSESHMNIKLILSDALGKMRMAIDKERADSLRVMLDSPKNLFFSVSTWKKAHKQWLIASNLQHIWEDVKRSVQTSFIDKAVHLNEEIQDFASVLEILLSSYGAAENALESKEQLSKCCSLQFSNFLNLLSDNGSFDWARHCAEETVNLRQKKCFRQAVAESFGRYSSKWTGTSDNGKAVIKLLDDCLKSLSISEELNQKLSLPEFIKAMCTGKREKQREEIEKRLHDIASQLVAGSKGFYPQSGNAFGGKVIYVLYPMDLEMSLDKAVNKKVVENALAKGAGNLLDIAQVVPSSIPDRIIALSHTDSLPLFSLSGIEVLENCYNDLKVAQTMRHRNEPGHVDFSATRGDFRGGKPEPHGFLVNYPLNSDARYGKYDPLQGLAWRDYPHLALRHPPGLQETQFVKDEFQKIWDEACHRGIIQLVDNKGINPQRRFHCRCGVFPNHDIGDLLMSDVVNENGLLMTGAELVNYLIDVKKKGKRYSICILEAGYLSKGSPNETRAMENAQRALRRNVPLYIEVKKAVRLMRQMDFLL